MSRPHQFTRGPFTIWAHRLPVMHGKANLFTLWERLPDRSVKRHGSAQLVAPFRQYLKTLGAQS